MPGVETLITEPSALIDSRSGASSRSATERLAAAAPAPTVARMPQYVALLRGIGPVNPATRNEKLAALFAEVGCSEVRPLLASGNFVFRSTGRDATQLETKLEQALAAHGVTTSVIVRAQEDLEAMIAADPFAGANHGSELYLTVTFFKDRRPPLYSKLERGTLNGPEFMAGLEKRYGKQITTRTWNTLQKIVAKMGVAGATSKPPPRKARTPR